LGKAKRRTGSDARQKKRPAHTCRSEKAVPVNEGSLGRKKEGGRNKDC
jgi:hypothetical protein